MGKYKELEEFSDKQFRRLTGVQRGTFEKMVSVLSESQQRRYRRAGRKTFDKRREERESKNLIGKGCK